MEKSEINANWIWTKNNTQKNNWVCFRKKFLVTNVYPKKVIARISAETKYYLYINGNLVVFEGSLNRGPLEKGGYIDLVDLSKYLRIGFNIIAVIAWFWGNEGRNNINSGAGGFVFESAISDDLIIKSDRSWKTITNPAFGETREPFPSYLYGGYNIGYNANYDLGDFTNENYDDSKWENAVEYGFVPCEPWADLYKRPIPLLKFSKLKKYKEILKEGNKIIAELPYACHITPYFKIISGKGRIIDIRTDRYTVNGGPGDNINLYNGHRVEYITKDGEQEFEALNWIFGEKVIYSVPDDVKILSLKYRESGYNTKFVGDFKCDNQKINTLIEKCKRTLYVCMRDNFMDCPDRERGQWIGDVSVQVPQVFYSLNSDAHKLVKKAILEFINLRKGDVLVGNVPGANFCELPSQSLAAISALGMIGKYYEFTGDKDVLKLSYEPIIQYLKLWEIGQDGLVIKREGNWYWFDHLVNVDAKILENEWYYCALTFAKKMSEILEIDKNTDFICKRMKSIENVFEKTFWKEDGFSSGEIIDDRANAMAVLSGLANEDQYMKIRDVLINVNNATPYMESFVLESLFKMGFYKDGYERMQRRYDGMITNENTTLWEDFEILGTKNHAWSGGPLTILYKYFAGLTIKFENGYKVEIDPYLADLNYINASMLTKYGMIYLEIKKEFDKVYIKVKKPSRLDVVYKLDYKKFGIKSINDIILC